ncbi:MAG: hypothetical protein J1E00_01290 [Oscillospiraceae bacterium]|nr:hypothetical protein [Oscillospiraceae bacterium]
MKKFLIRSALLVICIILAISLCACGGQSDGAQSHDAQSHPTPNAGELGNNLTLSVLRDMTLEEAETFFGTPDVKDDVPGVGTQLVYYDRFTFYGSELKTLIYTSTNHSIKVNFSDADSYWLAKNQIRVFGNYERTQSEVVYGDCDYYSYGTIIIQDKGSASFGIEFYFS